MKLEYIAPEALVVQLTHQVSILADSDPIESDRNAGGDPTNNGLPGNVGETDGETDPYGDHGQGSGGGGNRAKGWNAWSTWD